MLWQERYGFLTGFHIAGCQCMLLERLYFIAHFDCLIQDFKYRPAQKFLICQKTIVNDVEYELLRGRFRDNTYFVDLHQITSDLQ
jgi:hypothetical protein